MSLVTPRQPVVPRRPRVRERFAVTSHGTFATRWARLDLAAATCRGTRQTVNEDCHSALETAAPVYVVADGVGSGAMAAWVSRQIVARLHASLSRGRVDAQAIGDALLDADRGVRDAMADRTPRSGAATVVLCASSGSALARWSIGWAGDCRAYLISREADAPCPLTQDDTYRHLRETPPLGGSLDDPARMVGNGAILVPNVAQARLRAGDMLLLCSDGVHKHVADADIARVMRDETSLARGCLRLLERARLAGGRDDATVLVVRRESRAMQRLARTAGAGVAIGAIAVALIVAATVMPRWTTGADAPNPPAAQIATPVQQETERP